MPDDGSKLSWFEKLRGQRYHDIELQNESGKVDPKLKGTSVRERIQMIRPSLEALKDLTKGGK